jgi:hypothetical protein
MTSEVPACSPDLRTNLIESPIGGEPLGEADGAEDGYVLEAPADKERFSGRVVPVAGSPVPVTVLVVVVVAVDVEVYVTVIGATVTLIVMLFSI